MIDLDQLRKDREAGTKGPWKTHLVDDTSIVSNDGIDVATTCDSSNVEREDAYNIEYERMEADARRIARVPEMEDTIIAQAERIEALEAVLGRIPGALNSAFAAGIEEREGGSERRQLKALEIVEALRADARAALEAKP